MTDVASAPGPPVLYRACFLIASVLLAVSCVAGFVHTVAGRFGNPGRLDPRAAAEALEVSGDLAGAARELRMLTLVDPGDCGAFDALGAVLARSGDLEGSVQTHRRHVAVHPYYGPAHVGLGLAFLRVSRVDDAFGSFGMALRLSPGNAVALASMGDIARQRGRLDEAVSLYERALASTQEPARLHNKLAIAHALAGRSARAAGHFGEALRLDPGLSDARTNLRLLEGEGEPLNANTR